MADRDHLAAVLADLPRDPPSPRKVTEAAATYGWYPDPPWLAPVPVGAAKER